ncbi:MAG: DUF3108 domain-containing protein [Ignavibacteriales bacterium]|nr:DUF3108 domain-containing protein [Ignavibacteriales bacterium]
MKRGVAGLAGSLFIGGLLIAVPPRVPLDAEAGSRVLASAERLQYKVKWLFFRLGTITASTDRLPGSGDLYRTAISLDSNPDLFFISIHNRYEAIIRLNPIRCEAFISREADGDDTLVTRYIFVDSLKQILMTQQMLPADTLVREEVRVGIDRFFEGASLIVLARSLVHRDTSVSVPTLVDFDLFPTDITFPSTVRSVSIGALKAPVRTRELFGKADFGGKTIGGFSGDFKGWFSDDIAAIPILAEMSITLGTVDVELEQWSREGWEPPLVPSKP